MQFFLCLLDNTKLEHVHSRMQAFITNTGRCVQGASSNCLGQTSAKMFESNYGKVEKGGKAMVWQNSWTYSTQMVTLLSFLCKFSEFFVHVNPHYLTELMLLLY